VNVRYAERAEELAKATVFHSESNSGMLAQEKFSYDTSIEHTLLSK
jgi:hypothetical protein